VRIFPKYYARRIYFARNLEKIIEELNPWIDEVISGPTPFLQRVSGYILKNQGHGCAPDIYKKVVSTEIIRLTGHKDLKAIVFLAIVESYRKYDPSKGRCDIVTWLAWQIPYIVSKWVTWKVTHPIEPVIESVDPAEPEFNTLDRHIGIISKELKRSYYGL
jgi:hypothetical protein